MHPKTTIEKLQVLLPHWVEHNENHEAEFKKWAAEVRGEGKESLAAILDQAVASMGATDAILKKALAEIGGPSQGHEQHHHHHHHYD
ncbi:hypothetical protein [Thiovibrio frasassiensis]|uniref:DUF8180 domain-containing protein n=1 Tax=Thiovibrio frasassiensis TaxID=2984131 RepID=A0A9X4MFD2_9BACT|nr:hypothetical protein [Thiovibrio frasassiensis]MDG4475331.1 hypothetical protein [Thiovibrio frasassiensis]